MPYQKRQIRVLGEIGRSDAVEGLARAVILGARQHQFYVFHIPKPLTRECEILLAQLHADDAAARKALCDRERGDAGAAREVENALGIGRDQADDAPLPQPVDAEGGDVDDPIVGAAGAAEEALDQRKPLVALGGFQTQLRARLTASRQRAMRDSLCGASMRGSKRPSTFQCWASSSRDFHRS